MISTTTADKATFTLTRAELVAALLREKISGFATLTTLRVLKDGELKAPKKNGTSGRISKWSRVLVGLNPVYSNWVNNQRGRETPEGEYMEEFVAEPRRWGERIKGTTLVHHKGKYYLETAIVRSLEVVWMLDGQPTQFEKIKDLIHQKKGESARQKTEKAIILRDWGVDTLVAIQYNGTDYQIQD